MTIAFGGDAGLKAALLTQLKKHADNGTLRFGATQWDGQGGSPLGVSVESGDSAEYAARFGYPLAMAGLLDPMTAFAASDRAVAHTLRWVSCVEPGTDLSQVPERIIRHLLVTMGSDRLAPRYYHRLRALYRAEARNVAPQRRCWSDLRTRIEQAVEGAPPGSDTHVALRACATACWPIRTSSSILSTLTSLWVQDATRAPDPEFGEADRAQAHAMLDRIFHETQSRRDAGEAVDIPAIFRCRAPALAAAFEARLDRTNARYRQRARTVPDIVLLHLETAYP